ncbi:MAG: DNA primase, partial [Comamonas sp.]|nr:DNA primase [Candidatus Comamonas equi]
LFRFTDSVVFSFDGDSAGRRAAHKALEAALPYATDTRSIKFLFLPAEHDPDSFIREHGSDAFVRHISNALPLNAFLLEAASADCDLGQAQGRAKLSSQARPLWNLLPDGAFKRLVLGELAQKIHIETRELSELWAQAHAQETRYQRSPSKPAPSSCDAPPPDYGHSAAPWEPDFAPPPPLSHASGAARNYQDGWRNNPRSDWKRTGGGKFDRKKDNGWQPLAQGPRVAPSTAPDQAARLLLSHMRFMDQLDNDDLDTLVHLPAPHGPLFAWIESQFQENGPLPWAVLKTHAAQSVYGAFAAQLMDSDHGHPEGEEAEQLAELRRILSPMMAKRIEVLEREALNAYAANPSDPHIRTRYQHLVERRKQLQAAALPPSDKGN